MRVLSLGGVIQSLIVPDRAGHENDIVLGYDSVEEYAQDPYYIGAIVGRYANRIAGARFTLDGQEYTLARNNGANHLHGGPCGFHSAVWDADPCKRENGSVVELRYTSPAHEEGYPGTLHVRVTYTLTPDNELIVDFHAIADAPTPVNPTQHSYFNLAGHDSGDILHHELTLGASRFLAVDREMIPTGEARDVAGTAFDFGTSHPIGERIDVDDADLRFAGGYDHCYVLDERSNGELVFAARLYEPRSGRTLEVHTTEPGIQVYSGNSLGTNFIGKKGRQYGRRSGVALETQHFPNSPNEPRFPSTILRPGDEYASRTLFRFSW